MAACTIVARSRRKSGSERLVDVSGIRPGREARDDVKLSEEAADHLIGVTLGAEAIDLRHHAGQGLLDVADGAFGIVLALLFEAALALDKFFSIEI
jgi:hypothetical protein